MVQVQVMAEQVQVMAEAEEVQVMAEAVEHLQSRMSQLFPLRMT